MSPNPDSVNSSARRDDWIALAVILSLAFILRLDAVGYNHYLVDEADLAQLAQGIAAGAGRPTLGIMSSVGIPNSPISAYVLAVPFFVTGDPWWATAYVALLNTVGVGLLWWIAVRTFNLTVARWAALCYAVSPWAVWFSTKLWAQDIHTPLLLTSVLLAIWGFVDGRWWAQLLCIPIFIAALQIHFATLLLLPIVGWWLWIGRRRLSIPAVALGALVAGLTLYQYWLALLNFWPPGERGGSVIGTFVRGLADWRPDPLLFVGQLATGLGVPQSISAFYPADHPTATPLLWPLWIVLALLALVGVWRVGRDSRLPNLRLQWWWWLCVPVILFLPSGLRVYIHYFVHFLPLLCLFIGLGMAWAMARLGPQTGRVLSAIVVVILCAQQVWWRDLLAFLNTTSLPEQGTPLHYLTTVRHGLMKTGADDFLVVTDGSKSTDFRTWRAFLFRSASCVRQPRTEQDGVGMIVLPRSPFAVLTAPDSAVPLLAGLTAEGVTTYYPQRPDEAPYSVTLITERPRFDELTFIPVVTASGDAPRFDNGFGVLGYALTADRLYVRWAITTPPARNLQFFAHFLDAQGDKRAQRDVHFLDRDFLCAGDEIVAWLDLPRPSDSTTVRIGLYALDGSNVISAAVIGANGERGLPWIDVALPTP